MNNNIIMNSISDAHSNKLYESIYFNCPIVVSRQTFLEDKVKRLKLAILLTHTMRMMSRN